MATGKDHFREVWRQTPLYSGGSVAAITPQAAIGRDDVPSALLAAAFDRTVHVVDATTGEVYVSHDAPLDEDVILNVDATGFVPEGVTAASARPNDDDDSPQPVVLGFVAFSTESLQITVLRIDAMHDGTLKLVTVKTWTAAQHAIALLRFSPNGASLASGATDGGLRVWDVHHHHVTHNYRGKGGIVTCLDFSADGKYLVAGVVEGYVSVIDFVSKAVLATGRPFNSPIETGSFHSDGTLSVLCRDRRIATFNPRSLEERKSIVLRDHIATARFIAPATLVVGTPEGVVVQCAVAVDGGVTVVGRTAQPEHATEAENSIRAVATLPAHCGAPRQPDARTKSGVPKAHRAEPADLNAASVDTDVVIVAADASQRLQYLRPARNARIETLRTLCGYLDQVFDIKPLPAPTDAASAAVLPLRRLVASNNKDLLQFDGTGIEISASFSGHSDIVTCLDVSSDGAYVCTGSKDESMRLWDVATRTCIGVGKGHAGSVAALAMTRHVANNAFLCFTVGTDEVVKSWNCTTAIAAFEKAGRAAAFDKWQPEQSTVHAHLGAIHCVAVAPNDAFVATGGKDKGVGLWKVNGKTIQRAGTFTGHRRAVNAVQFAPAERILASASNDGAVRLWSLTAMSCAKTLQMDKTGITQLRWFNGGAQLCAANASGVLRMWAVGAAEVVASLDAHTDRVWALAVIERGDETFFVTGGADSSVVCHEDYTAEEANRLKAARDELVLANQKLDNALRRKDYVKAFKLALGLKHPRHLRMVITAWLTDDATACEDGITDIIATSSNDDLTKLLEFTRDWITNARNAIVASVVIAALLRAYHFGDLRSMYAVKETIEALASYNARHETRATTVLGQLHYVDYLTRSLRQFAGDAPVAEAAGSAGIFKVVGSRKFQGRVLPDPDVVIAPTQIPGADEDDDVAPAASPCRAGPQRKGDKPAAKADASPKMKTPGPRKPKRSR